MNDNDHSRYGIIESFGLNQFAVVEYDQLGPIMRLGPYASRHHALDRMNALITLLADRGMATRPGGGRGARRR